MNVTNVGPDVVVLLITHQQSVQSHKMQSDKPTMLVLIMVRAFPEHLLCAVDYLEPEGDQDPNPLFPAKSDPLDVPSWCRNSTALH